MVYRGLKANSVPRHANFWQQLRESLPGTGRSAPLELSFQHRPFATCLRFMSETCRVITKCQKAFQKELTHQPLHRPPSIPPVAALLSCAPVGRRLPYERPSQTPPHFAFIPTSSRAGTVRAVCSDCPSPRRLSSCVRHACGPARARPTRPPRVARQDC